MNLYQDFPNLCASLGTGASTKIAMHLCRDYVPGSKRVRMIDNPHTLRLRRLTLESNTAVDDIISGIARLDYGSDNVLSAQRIFSIIQSAERISSELLAEALNVTDRQARRYMAACKLAVFHLTRHFTSQRPENAPTRRSLTLAEIRAAHKAKP